MDAIASENVLTHGVPLPQDVRLFSVLRREYKRLCAALRSFDLWFCMRDGVARNVCARSAGMLASLSLLREVLDRSHDQSVRRHRAFGTRLSVRLTTDHSHDHS